MVQYMAGVGIEKVILAKLAKSASGGIFGAGADMLMKKIILPTVQKAADAAQEYLVQKLEDLDKESEILDVDEVLE